MNKSVSTLIRLIALSLLAVMALSLISCDKLPFDLESIFKPDVDDGETPACEHQNVIDNKCYDCGEIFVSTIKELSLNDSAPNGYVDSQLYYIRASVNEIINAESGEMTVEDETGSIHVKTVWSEDGTPFDQMTEKPDEEDEVLLHCMIEKVSGEWQVKHAFLIEFKPVESSVKTITIAEAIEICKVNSEETTERYLIRATVTKVSNPTYGEMYIADETGEILVYNTKNSDGSVNYADMTDRPVKGDEVLLSCTLNNYNGTNQIKSAYVIEFKHVQIPFDEANYTKMTIGEARAAEVGTGVRVSGVVAQITYANGYKPSGVILVDGTSSIYVYDGDIAGQVEIGNTIEVAGSKAYWILDAEISNAAAFGYKGSNQIEDAYILSNDKGKSDFDKSWIDETTLKNIMDTPYTQDITNKIFKANALVKKAPGQGFVNYYIDDLDGVTGSYVYTQCNGGDFAWLDEFDGKICTVYFVAMNAKSTSSGCVWRLLPISVSDDGYKFDTTKAAEFAVKYYGIGQFINSYTGDPQIQLIGSVDSELLGFTGATLSYSSSDEKVAYITTDENGVMTFHCGEAGSATVTVTGSYNGTVYSETVDITVSEKPQFDSITVSEAIAAENNSTVIVHGIVGPSLANQVGFYLIDDSGVIPVRVASTAFAGLEIGHEIIVQGTRTITKDGGGQICIDSAEILSNAYGNGAYSTKSFITGKTVADICALTDSAEQTTSVYVVTATISRVVGGYSTNTYLVDGSNQFMLYAGGPAQYAWLDDYNDQTVTVEVAVCDWNAKGLKGCVLSVTLEDGTQLFNELNFN